MDLQRENILDAHSVWVGKLPKNFFSSSINPKELMGAARKSSLLYVPTYDAQESWVSAAAQSGCAIVFSMCDVAKLSGIKRAILISKMRILLGMCKKYGTNVYVCSLAYKEYEIRNEHERLVFAMYLGMERKDAKKSLGMLAEKLKGME